MRKTKAIYSEFAVVKESTTIIQLRGRQKIGKLYIGKRCQVFPDWKILAKETVDK